MWNYINAHPEIADDGGYSWTKQYLNIDFRAPSEEAMKFLENRENIRNKEFFLQSRHFNGFGVVCLDAELIMRYHLLNTLKPEYFDEEYYMDTIGYPRIEVFDYIYNVERMKEKSPPSSPISQENFASVSSLTELARLSSSTDTAAHMISLPGSSNSAWPADRNPIFSFDAFLMILTVIMTFRR